MIHEFAMRHLFQLLRFWHRPTSERSVLVFTQAAQELSDKDLNWVYGWMLAELGTRKVRADK